MSVCRVSKDRLAKFGERFLRRAGIVLAALWLVVPQMTHAGEHAAVSSLDLTEAEKAFIVRHPKINIGIDAGYAPYSFLDADGQFVGMALDFLARIEASTGLEFEPAPGLSWPQIVQGAKERSLDVIATAVRTPERERFLNFTEKYIPTPLVITARKGDLRILGTADLPGKTVALVKKYSSSQRVLQEHPGIIPRFVKTPLDGLQAVATGAADAYVGVLGVNAYLSRKHGLINLSVAAHYDLRNNGQRFGVRKDWPELASILDKALRAMGEAEKARVMRRWVSAGQGTAPHGTAKAFQLNAKERAWLAERKNIRIGANLSWPPISYRDKSGHHTGIDAGYIKALNRRLNGLLTVELGSWDRIYNRLKDKELDALMGITPRANRQPFFEFTEPYIEVPHAIFAPEAGVRFNGIAQLAGKSVAVEAGFFIADVLRQQFPDVTVQTFKSTREALYAVSQGDADAYIGNRAVATYIIQDELISNLLEHGRIDASSSVNAIGVRKDWPILRDILQKALDSMPPKERQLISKDWVTLDKYRRGAFELSRRERQWLAAHPVIRVAGDRAFSPIEFIGRDGAFNGVAVEYLKRVQELLGVRFEFDLESSWPVAVEKLKRRELDMFSAVAATDTRQKYATFTAPYLSLPVMIFTRSEFPYAGNLAALAGRKVALVKGYAATELIRAGDWDLQLVPVADVAGGLQKLQTGDVDAYVGSILVTNHYLRQAGHTNLVVGGQTPYVLNLAMAARSDWPILAGVLGKAFNHISERERAEIIGKWIGLTIKTPIDYRLLWQVTSAIGAILLLLVLWIWRQHRQSLGQRRQIQHNNQLLRDEVADRTQAVLAAEKASQTKSELLANISHELRTPLNAILGFSDILKSKMFGPLGSERYDSYANDIHLSGQFLLAIIDNLLRLSTIQAGEREFRSEPVALNDILPECIGKIEMGSRNGNIAVRWELSEQLPEFLSDRQALSQIINNIFANAVKFSRAGGTISIRSWKDGDRLGFTIEDTGIGIPQDEIRLITDPFYRVGANPHIAQAEGAGLGLSVVKALVDSLAGKLSIDSEPGSGTSVTVSFPATGIDVPRRTNPD
ncbi:MAG: transporter substrate-binding domain-containing protein [Rhodospirillaceae bacterium]|nr:transporter substrate-binding domain-containing protein [Rhodospirillaceae bacterium]